MYYYNYIVKFVDGYRDNFMNRHTTFLLSMEEKELLERKAFECGYLQTRGAGAGKLGSISMFMRAIARGEINLPGKKKNRVLTQAQEAINKNIRGAKQ
jgi:hypothetical protein